LRVVFSKTALSDVATIRAYIRSFDPTAEQCMVDGIMKVALGLGDFPLRGTPRPDGARESAAVRPYIIVYEVGHDRVAIVRIWHGAQRRF
jgi:plasmid stabilization system protein ParE